MQSLKHLMRLTVWVLVGTAIGSTFALAAEPVLHEIRFEQLGEDKEKVYFKLNGFFPPKTFGIEEKQLRLVCDFADTQLQEGVPHRIDIRGNCIQRLRIGIHPPPQPKVRVVFDLVLNQDYAVQQVFYKKENIFAIIISRQPPSPSP